MKRWIIRGFFIGLLLLCVGGYGMSFTPVPPVFARPFYTTPSTDPKWSFWGFSINDGDMRLFCDMRNPTDFSDGFHRRWLGFRVLVEYNDAGYFVWWAIIPMWFPTAVSTALLWLVWRKTRPKPDPRTAFPVEAKQTIDEKTP